MNPFKPNARHCLAAGAALGLFLAMPSQAAPFVHAPMVPATGAIIKVQQGGTEADSGAEELRKDLRKRKKRQEEKAKSNAGDNTQNAATGKRKGDGNESGQPAPQDAGQTAKNAAPSTEQSAKPADQPESSAPARKLRNQPTRKPENEAGNSRKEKSGAGQDTEQNKKKAETPKPKRVTVPKPKAAGVEAQQSESSPEQGSARKPERVKRSDKTKASEPEPPAPKTVTVPKKQRTAPVEAGSAKAPQETGPAKPGGSSGEKLRRDLREKLRRKTEQQAREPAPETATKGEQAPLTDSAKEAVGAESTAQRKARRQAPAAGGTQQSGQAQTAPQQELVVTPETLPKTDRSAQAPEVTGQKIESIQAESGTATRSVSRPRRQFDDRRVVSRSGDRTVIRLDNGRLSVYSTDDHDSRLRRHADNTRYEDLRGGRLRETIYLRDGSRIVTIYNRDGDILRRSRILPDGREILLVYVPRDRWDELRDPYYDPGRYLPPLIITIPRSDYIFERERASADDYYDFLRQPPVEPVPRLYSVDEVTRSARLRDMARRVDLVSVHFEFGSAAISESEVDELQTLAEAMNRLLDENPGEMFLIEGHTDAVGSEEANLILSDKRAESVAEVLTDYFGIPPENMVTHGYGERYLKINTQAPERENRRVAIRRITPLVAPANEQVLR